MGKLFKAATEQSALRSAWQRIRANGAASLAPDTRVAIETFERDESRNIYNIQRRLRAGTFEFAPQTGVLKRKKDGGKRGIVMASVHNRVVERAWLDSLQKESAFVRKVINFPMSIGGVPYRSVPHGLKIIHDAFSAGKLHYVRSDISGFFDHIPRTAVLNRISQDVDDDKFITTLAAATTVVLANEQTLGEDRRVFPTDEEGVAQGSPLSPLFGNVLLYDFDVNLNDRGLVCVRFIDDFVLLGDSESEVTNAFQSAKRALFRLGLTCHDPFSGKTDVEKAGFGRATDGFVFLGYDIRPGLFQPSRRAREKLEATVEGHLNLGRKAILAVKGVGNSFENRQRYAQTQVRIDKVVRGWGDAFAYSNSPNTTEELDRKINSQLDRFREWMAHEIRGQDWKTRRRIGGVCLIADIPTKSLDDVPFVLERKGRFVRSGNTVTISTDGSIASHLRRKGKDLGPGGWAFVVHETNETGIGRARSVTNNQMELRAVIEAIRFIDPKRSIIVRTDSQYVHDAIERGIVVKSNGELWREYKDVSASRRIKIVWVKGHAGDPHNELVDKLASQQAELAKVESLKKVEEERLSHPTKSPGNPIAA
jgi:ribonuclease HI/retron-type reverse transcriptase